MQRRQTFGRFTMVALLTLMVGVTLAYAADDYTVLTRGSTFIGDGTATFIVTFSLPDNISTSSSTAKSAVLQFEADGVSFTQNEVFVNPPTTVCTDNTPGQDANEVASIGFLNDHAAIGETFAEHNAFSSARLQPGIACTVNSDCTTSGVCDPSGVCHNRLMICSRTDIGLADTATNNVDNFNMQDIVLHYKTN